MALFIYFFHSFFDLHFLFKPKTSLGHPSPPIPSFLKHQLCPLISPPPPCGGRCGVSGEIKGYGVGGTAVRGPLRGGPLQVQGTVSRLGLISDGGRRFSDDTKNGIPRFFPSSFSLYFDLPFLPLFCGATGQGLPVTGCPGREGSALMGVPAAVLGRTVVLGRRGTVAGGRSSSGEAREGCSADWVGCLEGVLGRRAVAPHFACKIFFFKLLYECWKKMPALLFVFLQ